MGSEEETIPTSRQAALQGAQVSRLVRRAAPILVLLITVPSFLWLLVRRLAFGIQPEYDDKGYMLLSLWHFVKEGGLYTHTFSQYGPFYFLLQPSLHRLLRIPITNDGSILLTLVYLLVSTLVLSWFVHRLTGSWPLSLMCFFASATAAIVIFQESGHPQEVVLLLLVLGICCSLLISKRRLELGYFLLGITGAALSLTKINVGVFFVFAIWLALSSLLPQGIVRRALFFGIVIVSLAVPPLLMQHHFRHWSISFCILTVIILLGMCWAVSRIEVLDPIDPIPLWYVPLGGAAGSAAVIVWALQQGIGAGALLDGILLRPMKHPDVFSYPWLVPWPALILSLLLALATASAWLPVARRPNIRLVLGISKLVVGPLALVSLCWIRAGAVLTGSLLPLLLVEPYSSPRSRAFVFPRLLLCSVIAYEVLQDYPVAATHLNVTFMPAAAWGCLLIYDGCQLLKNTSPLPGWLVRNAIAPITGAVFSCLFTGILFAKIEHRHLELGPSIDLPGSRLLHLAPDFAARFRWLAATLHENCDVLYGIPEIGSLNFWAEVPTPNGLNMGGWPTAFTHSEQQTIVDDLRRSARACIVHNEPVRRFWAPYGELRDAPLVNYIFKETTRVSASGDYEIRVPVSQVQAWREDVILDHAKSLAGDAVGLPEDLVSESPQNTIRFSIKAQHGRLSLASSGGNAAGLPQLTIQGTTLSLAVGPTSTKAFVSGLDNGRWHHLALVSTADRADLFVDGIKQVSVESATAYRLPASLYLLRGAAFIDDFKVVRHAWTAEQVLENAHAAYSKQQNF